MISQSLVGVEILPMSLSFSIGWSSIVTMFSNVVGFDVIEASVGGRLRADGRLPSRSLMKWCCLHQRCAFF